jgi:hypothetical protein
LGHLWISRGLARAAVRAALRMTREKGAGDRVAALNGGQRSTLPADFSE